VADHTAVSAVSNTVLGQLLPIKIPCTAAAADAQGGVSPLRLTRSVQSFNDQRTSMALMVRAGLLRRVDFFFVTLCSIFARIGALREPPRQHCGCRREQSRWVYSEYYKKKVAVLTNR
jgi:hypothetical protein